MNNLNPDKFIAAADLIESRGWWNGKEEATLTSHCPVSAIYYIPNDLNNSEYVDVVIQVAGAKDSKELYAMNDNQPSYEIGKAWAISTLRKAAEFVRKGASHDEPLPRIGEG